MKSCWKCEASVPDTYRYCLGCGSDVDARPSPPGDPLLGRVLVDKYRLMSVIGSGAMGTIYKAEQLALGKEIVIKLLHRHLLSDPELSQRFQREARAASRLNHPNCVQIIDFGQTDNASLYIAMEYIPGGDLADLLDREFPLDHRRLIHIVKQVCLALDEAHANGVLHRDLKPENVMLTDRRNESDFVKVVDFGIAKLDEHNPNSTRQFRTRTGIVCGTPEYMSPEQARGKDLDARSDIYALGVALYHLSTNHLPFDGPSPIEIVTKHLSEDPAPPRELRPDLPEALDRLILTMMEKDRDKRPGSAMDVYAELERIDRELALARREPVEQNHKEDATFIDLQPNPIFVEAMARAAARSREAADASGAGARDPQLVATVEVPPPSAPAAPAGSPGSGLVAAARVVRPASAPEARGPASVLAAAAPATSEDDTQPNREGDSLRDAATAALTREAQGRRRPDAELFDKRAQITVSTPPVSELSLMSGLDDEVRPGSARRLVLFGVALALLGLVAWLVMNALG